MHFKLLIWQVMEIKRRPYLYTSLQHKIMSLALISTKHTFFIQLLRENVDDVQKRITLLLKNSNNTLPLTLVGPYDNVSSNISLNPLPSIHFPITARKFFAMWEPPKQNTKSLNSLFVFHWIPLHIWWSFITTNNTRQLSNFV